MIVDRHSPDVRSRGLQCKALPLGDVREHPKRLGHDLGSNVIPGENGELEVWHGKGVYRYPLGGQR